MATVCKAFGRSSSSPSAATLEGVKDGVDVFLCGDVMLGRGIDQILPNPGDPALNEPAVHDARTYVRLAERAHGPIDRPVDFSWPWGGALAAVDRLNPDVRIVNLETAITRRGSFAPDKDVHYRMNPRNIEALCAIRPTVCTLANNHSLDFGPIGLRDTLDALRNAGIAAVGAGLNIDAARCPARISLGNPNVLVVGVAATSSGVPLDWEATSSSPGIWVVPALSPQAADDVATELLIRASRHDITIASIHWGANWGYEVREDERSFAHRLIDAGVNIVHGHSSHHPRPLEIYRNRPIFYGCGDLIDDYEGIEGHQGFRPDLRLLYFMRMDTYSGELTELRLVPVRARNLRLEEITGTAEAYWLAATLSHLSWDFGTLVETTPEGMLVHATHR